MSKLENVHCIYCGYIGYVHARENPKFGGWKVYCYKCGNGRANTEKDAVDAYMRMVRTLKHYKTLCTELIGFDPAPNIMDYISGKVIDE